ncbi:hypothetical protein ONZ45_g16512 [Pleurotus djamor]|nr:hypothetical protein ONZ45_g16512 [Pleurotus djamor]
MHYLYFFEGMDMPVHSPIPYWPTIDAVFSPESPPSNPPSSPCSFVLPPSFSQAEGEVLEGLREASKEKARAYKRQMKIVSKEVAFRAKFGKEAIWPPSYVHAEGLDLDECPASSLLGREQENPQTWQ